MDLKKYLEQELKARGITEYSVEYRPENLGYFIKGFIPRRNCYFGFVSDMKSEDTINETLKNFDEELKK